MTGPTAPLRHSPGKGPPVLEITLVKAAEPGDGDRAYLSLGGVARRPVTPAGVRDRVARQQDPALADLLARLDDKTIAMAIHGVRDLERRWIAVPPGGTLRLSWPLARESF